MAQSNTKKAHVQQIGRVPCLCCAGAQACYCHAGGRNGLVMG